MKVVLTRGVGDVNPYVGPGLAGVPSTLLRSMPTLRALAAAIRESMMLRKMSVEDVARDAQIPVRDVEQLATKGVGTLKATHEVLDVLRIRAVSLPPLSTFKAVETHEDAAHLV